MIAPSLVNRAKSLVFPSVELEGKGLLDIINEKHGNFYTIVCILIDLILLNVSGMLAFSCVDGHSSTGVFYQQNALQIILINFIWFNVSQWLHLYKSLFIRDAVYLMRKSVTVIGTFLLALTSLSHLIEHFNFPLNVLWYTGLIFLILFIFGKIAFLVVRRKYRRRLIKFTPVVILGAGKVGLELKAIIDNHVNMGYKVEGFFDDQPGMLVPGSKMLGRVDDCMAYMKKHNIREVFCALPDNAFEKINKLMSAADQEMIRFKVVPDVKNYFRKDVSVRMMDYLPVISPRSEPLENLENKVFKRIFDFCFALGVLVFVMSWLLPIVALLIKLDSKGPVFFRQLRSGKNNKPFWCYKFRSMTVNMDADHKQASKGDARVTKVGSFLRKSSLDELPQFFNVLMGEMSVVGPRPHMLKHTDEYASAIDQFMVRHLVLPGITGWAQVTGLRGGTEHEGAMEGRVKADIWYLENWSVFLDLKIIFLTIWQVFKTPEAAY